jgi:hypothetical protein
VKFLNVEKRFTLAVITKLWQMRVLERLKGVPDWKIGEIRDVHISLGIGEPNLKIRPRSPLVLIAGFGPLHENANRSRLRLPPSIAE